MNPLKVYRVERRCCVLPARVADSLNIQHHASQADVLVVARSAAAAKSQLADIMGMRLSAGALSAATGDDLKLLRAAGLLDDSGTVLVYRGLVRDETVVSVTSGSVVPVGAWRYVEQVGGARPYKRIIFERLDGHRFGP